MSYTTKTILWAAGLIIIAGLVGWFVLEDATFKTQDTHIGTSSKILFTCSDDKTIQAHFSDHSVNLQLSNSRNLMLKRVVSGSGARYANKDEDVVFWNKGNTAFITEHDSMSYQNCVVKGQDNLVNLTSYKKSDIRFRYPRMLQKYRESVKDTSGWSYGSVKKGNLIVQFKLDSSVQPKTNLSEATFTIGQSDELNALQHCRETPQAAKIKTDSVKKGGIIYFRSLYSDAGAGNFYQVRQFRTLHRDKCYSIEEMVHSTNIHNYPPERGISEFDSARVWKALDVAWQTFSFTR